MAKDITLDPQTAKEIELAVNTQYSELIDSIEEQGIDLEELDSQDIAQLFFLNGFMRGIIAMHNDEDLRETVLVMDEEIKIQTGE